MAKRYWLTATLAALLLRLTLLLVAPRYTYLDDHELFVCWGRQAVESGVAAIYDQPPAPHTSRLWQDGRWSTRPTRYSSICNYPPLSVYLLYISGLLFKYTGGDQLINTITARALFSFWSIAADFLLAAGVAALVASYKPLRWAWWAYLLTLLAPPLWWDSVMWGQMDSVTLAPAVWMLWAMRSRRWPVAGVLFGLTAALKPQAVVFLPVWALAAVLVRPLYKPLSGLAAAAAVLLASAIPFMLHSGAAWWQASYLFNLMHAYQGFTTLQALNIWYLDLLIGDSIGAHERILYITKEYWGRELLGIALAAGFIVMIRRQFRGRTGDVISWLPWTVYTLIAFVMLPTRVHERYILLVIPFLIAAAFCWRRFIPALAMLLIVATAALTWPQWIRQPAGQWWRIELEQTAQYYGRQANLSENEKDTFPTLDDYLQRQWVQYRQRREASLAWEWLFTILALSGAVAAAAAALSLRPPAPQNATDP